MGAVIADKGYDADVLVAHIEAAGAEAIIPPRSNRKHPVPMTHIAIRPVIGWSVSSIN